VKAVARAIRSARGLQNGIAVWGAIVEDDQFESELTRAKRIQSDAGHRNEKRRCPARQGMVSNGLKSTQREKEKNGSHPSSEAAGWRKK
jgi:hypothetical protein